MADDPRHSGGASDGTGPTRRTFLGVAAASGAGLVGASPAGGARGADEVPIVWRRDRFGRPETVRYVPRERARRIDVYRELRPGRLYGEVAGANGVTLVQRSDDPTDLALTVYVDRDVGSARRALPDRVRGVPLAVERRETDRSFLGVCRPRVTDFYDPLPANVEIRAYGSDDEYHGSGTLGVVCWTDGRTSGNVDEGADGEDRADNGTDGDEGDDESGNGSQGRDGGDGDEGGDGGGGSDGEGTDGESGDGGDGRESDSDEGGDGEDGDDEELMECYITATHVVRYVTEASDGGDDGEGGDSSEGGSDGEGSGSDGSDDGAYDVAEYVGQEGLVDDEETTVREEYAGRYLAHSPESDHGLDVALYRRLEDAVPAAPLRNDESRLNDVAGAWTHAGLTDRTAGGEPLPVAYAGRTTCYAELECVETSKTSMLEYQAAYSPNEVAPGDSGGPMLDGDGILVGTVSYRCEDCERTYGPTGQELLDRLGASLAGPDEQSDDAGPGRSIRRPRR